MASDVASASPVAVPPRGLHRRAQRRRAAPARSVVGLCTASARWLNTTPPTRTRSGTSVEERLAGLARRHEPRRRHVRGLHRAGVVHGQHDRRLLGRHGDAHLRARERGDQRRHGQARRAASGAWRRQPGRRGTTETAVAGAGERRRAAPPPPLRRRRRRRRGAAGARGRAAAAAPGSSSAPAPAARPARRRASASRRRGGSPPRRARPGRRSWIGGRDVVGRRATALAADRDDHVARAHARLRGRAARRHLLRPRRRRSPRPWRRRGRRAGSSRRARAAGSRRARCWTARRSRCPTLPLPLPPVAIWELTPITRPLASSSGPPELPGLIGASVWMTESIWKPSGAWMWRPVPDTMPAVAVCGRPKGEPMATASWPVRTVLESASSSARSAPGLRRVDLQHGEVGGGVDAARRAPSRCGRRRTGSRRWTRRRRRARW